MKKLGKLFINPEKVIKNDELVNLRGGYDIEGGPYWVSCKSNGENCAGFWVETCPNNTIFYKCSRTCTGDVTYVCV